MAIKYTSIARGNPQNPDAPKKYYPQVTNVGKTTTREMAEQVSTISTLSSVDLVAALEAFLSTIPQELARGNSVSLGDFGTFRLRLQGNGADTAEALTSRDITKVLVSFRPGKRFKEILDRATFEKV
jgi:predicted histone-like DNA-binding protein